MPERAEALSGNAPERAEALSGNAPLTARQPECADGVWFGCRSSSASATSTRGTVRASPSSHPPEPGAARARNSLATLYVAEPNFYYWGVVPYVSTGMDSRRSAPRLAHVSSPRDRIACWISRRYFRRFFICLCSVVFRGRPEIQAGVAIVVSGNNRIAQFQK